MSPTPSATTTITQTLPPVSTLHIRSESPPASSSDPGRNLLPGPLAYDGSLDSYPHHEITTAIGREFSSDLQLSALLASPDPDVAIRQLATLVSRRGLCVFRAQDIDADGMMQLARKISDLTGSPRESNMCIHPVSAYTPELLATPKTQTISANTQRKGGGINRRFEDVSRWASVAAHSDVSFENVPADYSMLKINVIPPSGGDTLFWSCYDVLDRMSPSFRSYLETLTAEHNAEFFHGEAEKLGLKVRDDIERGNPLNKGSTLVTHHPVIRTNPVTGWKALFVNRGFTSRIDDVTKDESDMILHHLNQIVINNYDMNCRVRWEPGSLALWDNRCTWHSATFDYEEERVGDRASSLGERPYFDSKSCLKSDELRREGLKV